MKYTNFKRIKFSTVIKTLNTFIFSCIKFFLVSLESLLGNFSLLDKKFSQSFLSLSEILSFNYVRV